MVNDSQHYENNHLTPTKKSYGRYLLSSCQANMSPQQAADAWGDVEFLASQLNVTTLVGPSTNWYGIDSDYFDTSGRREREIQRNEGEQMTGDRDSSVAALIACPSTLYLISISLPSFPFLPLPPPHPALLLGPPSPSSRILTIRIYIYTGHLTHLTKIRGIGTMIFSLTVHLVGSTPFLFTSIIVCVRLWNFTSPNTKKC